GRNDPVGCCFLRVCQDHQVDFGTSSIPQQPHQRHLHHLERVCADECCEDRALFVLIFRGIEEGNLIVRCDRNLGDHGRTKT
ncbi:unnamed protein product, partial [Ectocarpus sp. 13 AM-2016]